MSLTPKNSAALIKKIDAQKSRLNIQVKYRIIDVDAIKSACYVRGTRTVKAVIPDCFSLTSIQVFKYPFNKPEKCAFFESENVYSLQSLKGCERLLRQSSAKDLLFFLYQNYPDLESYILNNIESDDIIDLDRKNFKDIKELFILSEDNGEYKRFDFYGRLIGNISNPVTINNPDIFHIKLFENVNGEFYLLLTPTDPRKFYKTIACKKFNDMVFTLSNLGCNINSFLNELRKAVINRGHFDL